MLTKLDLNPTKSYYSLQNQVDSNLNVETPRGVRKFRISFLISRGNAAKWPLWDAMAEEVKK